MAQDGWVFLRIDIRMLVHEVEAADYLTIFVEVGAAQGYLTERSWKIDIV
jgi:hypothetical protein